MLLNPGLAFWVCWVVLDWVRWECWVWWRWVVLVSVSKIITFAFHHLVISGVSCYTCLWLVLAPLVILLAFLKRPGRLALSSEFQWSEHSLQASSTLTGLVSGLHLLPGGRSERKISVHLPCKRRASCRECSDHWNSEERASVPGLLIEANKIMRGTISNQRQL